MLPSGEPGLSTDDVRVHVGSDCKLILRDGMAVLMVRSSGDESVAAWTAIDRKSLRAF